MADRNGGAGVRESADAMDTDGAGGQDVEHNAAADEFAERRDEREDEMMDTEEGVQGGEQGEDENEREGSEDGEGERVGSGAEESGAEVGEGGKGKKRKPRHRKGRGKGKGGAKLRIERATEWRKGAEEDEQSARTRGAAVIVHVDVSESNPESQTGGI